MLSRKNVAWNVIINLHVDFKKITHWFLFLEPKAFHCKMNLVGPDKNMTKYESLDKMKSSAS